MRPLARTDCVYTKLFCEENIWQLAALFIKQAVPASALEVLFISNHSKQVAVFSQNGGSLKQPLIWDYHVVLLHRQPSGYVIYDFDSLADFPCAAKTYLDLSFPQLRSEAAEYRPLFRFIAAPEYLLRFSSDRSHMQHLIEAHAFPAYPVIMPEKASTAITLQQYRDFNLALCDNSYILNRQQFLQKIS